MDLLPTINSCIWGGPKPTASSADAKLQSNDNFHPSDQEISAAVVARLRSAEAITPQLKKEVNDIVGPQGWTENIAKAVVAALESVIKQGREKVGRALDDSITRAENEAKSCFQFAKDHPYLTAGFVTIVAIGVLVFVAAWIVEALGFGELGPIAGSFAAEWESAYAGFIPKGSVFSFFQRLGMVWKRV